MTSEQSTGGSGDGILRREIYFPTFMFFKDLVDGAALNTSLRKSIYAMRADNVTGMHRSNVKQAGAWHSQDDLESRPEFGQLCAEILVATQSAFEDLSYDPQYEPHIDNMWANVSPKHAFNRMHVHPGVIYSGVYYVQAPKNSGRTYFSDPRVQAQMLRPRINDEGRRQAHNWSEVFFQPVEGRMVLFPAWLLHEVEPNLADEQGDTGNRISISFNITQHRRQAD